MTPVEIAELCHEVNRAYCQALGDHSQPPWDEAPDWQKKSAINSVMAHIENQDLGPETLHEVWLEEKKREWWTWGAIKDSNAKEHPCFVPFDNLPAEQQAKDYIFKAIVNTITLIQE